MHNRTIKSALISVFNKEGLEPIVNRLSSLGIVLYSTGGTYTFIDQLGLKVNLVEDLTEYPSIFGGRVKTLHPKIFGGILNRRADVKDIAEKGEYNIPDIDLVIVDLYPFEETVSYGGTTEEIIEKIDIGGISLIRAAAKNFKDVAVVTDPNDYSRFIQEWETQGGLSYTFRKELSQKVFQLMTEYNASIANYFKDISSNAHQYDFEKSESLRYGENPHQTADLLTFSNLKHKNIANADVLQGKELSYNNIVDADAAWECVRAFDEPACVIVKHANPCGVAEAKSIYDAYDLAFKTDPTSAFGGIIAFNRELDKATAEEINTRQFVEVVLATGFENAALNELAKKKNIRVLCVDLEQDNPYPGVIKKVSGGILIQSDDTLIVPEANLKCVTKRQPSKDEINDLMFAWRVAKFVKSNACLLYTSPSPRDS